jgi:hypothetical protein
VRDSTDSTSLTVDQTEKVFVRGGKHPLSQRLVGVIHFLGKVGRDKDSLVLLGRAHGERDRSAVLYDRKLIVTNLSAEIN